MLSFFHVLDSLLPSYIVKQITRASFEEFVLEANKVIALVGPYLMEVVHVKLSDERTKIFVLEELRQDKARKLL